MRSLDPAIKKIWAIRYAIWVTILTIGSVFYELPSLFNPNRDTLLPTGLLTLLVFGIGLAIVIFMPRLRYRFWAFDLREEELYLQRGVWTRVYTVVPLRRIQHLDVSRNLLEREFDLGRLVVYTAGTQGNRVVLPGLRYEEAEHLRDTVKDYILEDAV